MGFVHFFKGQRSRLESLSGRVREIGKKYGTGAVHCSSFYENFNFFSFYALQHPLGKSF